MGLFKKILRIINRQEKKRLYRLGFLNLLISILDIASLALLVLIINFYTQRSNEDYGLEFLPGWMVNNKSAWLIALFFVFFAIKNLLAWLVSRSQFRFVFSVAARLSETNLLRYLEGSYTDYIKVDSSVNIRRISQQPIEFAQYVLAGVQQMITEFVLIILATIAIIWFNAKLFLVLLIVLAPAVVLLTYLLKKRSGLIRGGIKATSEKTLQHLQEALSGYVEGNIYDRKAFLSARYISHQQSLNRWLSSLQAAQAMPSRLIEVFAIFGLLALVLVNRFAAGSSSVDLLTVAGFMAAAYKIIPGIAKILNLNGQARTYAFTADDQISLTGNDTTSKTDQSAAPSSIAFEQVSFRFNEKEILKDLSFEISAGDLLGVSGLSGKGKTTLVNLLLGFHEPDRGEITIDGITKQSEERKRFWKHISYVKQQPFLVHDSILVNITLQEEVSDAQKLAEAVELSGLSQLTKDDMEGLHRVITENGKNISGGQRQRIMIARALYKGASLIILDEPFNELDKASEKIMLEHFQQLARAGKMIMLITHNQESLARCNKIIRLDEH